MLGNADMVEFYSGGADPDKTAINELSCQGVGDIYNFR